MAETYISIDIETDGPIPGANSMLSLGSVAFGAAGMKIAAPGPAPERKR